ncbi:MAG: hypothetical protein JW864_13810 [Spirochaetes bacterium]|nr:hypothetical protein [Spirochaetota bacterium]
MINLRCTKKLLTRLRVSELEDENISTNLLGPWFANYFNISRKQYAIFTNERTVLSVVIPMKEISTLISRFIVELRRLLEAIGIPEQLINSELEQLKNIKFGRTNNRKLLGNMNDLTNGAYAWFGSPDNNDLLRLNLYLANYLVGPDPYRRPGEEAVKIFKKVLM